MSDIRDELLGSSINKKRILGVILVALLLVSVFAFSTFFFSFLFGTLRPNPNERKADTEYEYADPTPPPYPFDEDFWQDLLDQVDPEDIPELLDMLEEMFDGDIDDLDLGNFSQGLLDLLYSGAGEMEVFRVYDYLSFTNMSDVLWKYECFDQYTGTGWESTAGSDPYNFYAYGDYYSNYFPDPELLTLKMPISPNIGPNNMILPSLFPIPFIMENSISAPNLTAGTEQLYKTDFNSTTVELSFISDVDVNMTFELFGEHLKSPFIINSSAVEASWTPAPIQSKYLQLPPSIEVYKTNNPYFSNHTDILNQTIIDATDNAFEVANKIRIYLQTQFSFPMSPDDYDPAPDGMDVVEWFCETEQGVWSDFASAFCAFTRAFGVSSRFVDGFNSILIEEFFDNDEGKLGYAIKYKNLYSWSEIFVPTDVSGNGEWVQFDIFDSFGAGGNPLLGGNYNITVTADKYLVNRPDMINITATMSSNVGDPINNNRITFTDLTTGQEIGQDYTDSFGNASVLYNINNSHVVGPHIIEARYDFFTAGGTILTILGNIGVNLTNVNPMLVNRSDALPDTVNIQGILYDPLNNERVTDASVNILLFQIGTSIQELGAFIPPSIITDSSGAFDAVLDLNPSVSAGQYEVRADFNGTWMLYGIPWPVPAINGSSNRMGLNITTALTTWFYIDGVASGNPNLPSVARYQNLNLTARVIEESFGPVSNKRVYFYDYTRGGIPIGSDVSDAQGYASINYFIGGNSSTGPNLLYSMIGSQMNYSYYVLNEEPIIHTISGPNPRVINRTGSGITQFNIIGNITDGVDTTRPFSYSVITLTLLKTGINYSGYLIPLEGYPYQTGSSGYFDLTFGVAPNTPPGNYTLRLDFNGTVNLMSYPYPYVFNLPYINTSSFYSFDLEIQADSSLLFWIDGYPSDDAYNPIINRNGILNLTTFIHQAGTPVENGEWVYFFDATENDLFIGADQTNAGIAQVFYSTNSSTTAGPHLIYATWNNKYNFSYFVLDAPININLDICPVPREVNRSGSIGRNFLIHGYLNDSSNGNHIRFSQIEVRLYNGPTDVSFYLNEPRFVQLGGTGEIDLTYSVSASTPAINYTVQVLFYGIFIYAIPINPQFFNLNFLSNMTDIVNCSYDLKVFDPDDIAINFFIDGIPTEIFYSNPPTPETYSKGEWINFSVYITQSGSPVGGTVSFTDIYTSDLLGNPSVSVGYASILVNTASWHAGLHRIRAQWSGSLAFNITYVIINETINIFSSIDKTSVLRSVDSFRVSGTVQEGGELLRGLRVNLILLDSDNNDVSGYLIGSQTFITNTVGYYQFDNIINITCPQGQYYIRVDFNGTIDAPGIFMTNYMIHNSSLLILIDIIARTTVSGNYETNIVKDDWYYGDECYVYGYLTWDNGTAMVGMEINVTIRDGTGSILATQTGTTVALGFFNLTFTVGNWDDNTEVWVYFFPEDLNNFGSTEGYYILPIQQEFFRAP
jgi:hypothetical protein